MLPGDVVVSGSTPGDQRPEPPACRVETAAVTKHLPPAVFASFATGLGVCGRRRGRRQVLRPALWSF